MWKMPLTSGAAPRLQAGRRLEGTLVRVGQTALRERVSGANRAVKTTQRRWDDLVLAAAGARAERDLVKTELDEAVRDLAFDLGARSRGARRQAPYTAVFVDGVGRFVKVRLGDQEARIGLLI